MRVKIVCAYDGTDFHGWAAQPGLRTVQGVMEDGLALVLGLRRPGQPVVDAPHLVVAGRTDAGVHARQQICHVDIDDGLLGRLTGSGHDLAPCEGLRRRLGSVLPDDIVLKAVEPAPAGFDARFSALERTYVYRVCDDRRFLDPLTRRFVLFTRHPLDLDRLQDCAARIPGLRDFGSFALPNPGGTTIREVKKAFWTRRPVVTGADGQVEPLSGLLEFTIVADAFARSMVRSLVGAQIAVGQGGRSVDWFAKKLAVPRRESATGPIAAKGLCLEHIAYPADAQLAARAERIRARRTLSDGQ
jgi:tRNA pseudouridine38-40 synthase